MTEEIRPPLPEYYEDWNGPFYKELPVDELFREVLFKDVFGEYCRAPRLVVVDDRSGGLMRMQHVALKAGFRPRLIWVNSRKQASPVHINAIAREVTYGTAGAVVDKGLGLIDGIELCRQIADIVPTIMLTGEPNTRETHRVAQGYIERPINDATMIPLLYQITGLSI